MSESKRRVPIALKQGDEIPPGAEYKNTIIREEEVRQIHSYDDKINLGRQTVQVSRIMIHIYEVDAEVWAKWESTKYDAAVKRQNEIY